MLESNSRTLADTSLGNINRVFFPSLDRRFGPVQFSRSFAMDWSNEMTRKLIDEYEKQPSLWDVFCPEFKDREHKNNSWKVMAESAGVDVPEVQRKIHNLRNQWNAEHRKMMERKFSSGSEGPKSKWPYYDSLSFIKMSLEAKRGKSNYNEKEELNRRDTLECHGTMSFGGPHRSARKRKVLDEDYMTTAVEFFQKPTIKNETRDEFSIFADYVASELRQMEDRHVLAIAKHKINTVLFEASTGVYDHMSPVQPHQELCETSTWSHQISPDLGHSPQSNISSVSSPDSKQTLNT
ncbi:uncharacterized protein LOC122263888 [Penaeus japonicus]|uniref:uncharacterized protein LOC122263888 n=1 Tax=Penaeus japonicus TaxID=27405 RepID=UPI001C70F869|nr:uncharacterized protein LOC122263888 [Penaeus japonicus]